MNAFDQQMDVPDLTEGVDELLLNLVEIVEGKLFGGLRGGRQRRSFGCTPIKALESGGINRLTYAFAAGAAERTLLTVDGRGDFTVRGHRQTAMETGFLGDGFRHADSA